MHRSTIKERLTTIQTIERISEILRALVPSASRHRSRVMRVTPRATICDDGAKEWIVLCW
jgi:hypothetical protein